MAGRSYARLTIEEFGKHLLDTGDLDPLYIGLHRLRLDTDQKFRWMLAYWCFYDAGIASYLSERSGTNFWGCFRTAAANNIGTPAPIGNAGKVNGGWPRGKERRHFRGQQAVKATAELEAKYPIPEHCMAHLARAAVTVSDETHEILLNPDKTAREPYDLIRDRVQEWRGFGSWISFKVGDMLDRCGVVGVDFAFDEAMYDTPTKAAIMQWKVWHGAPEESTIDDEKAAVQEVVARLRDHFSDRLAAPLNDRPIGLQELETILCKWKSHKGGHYPLYNDIDEIGHGLAPWASHCEAARRLLAVMPSR